MSAALVAATLREIGRYIRVTDPRSFRARAYEQGAAAIESTALFDELVEQGRLSELAGIGGSLERLVEEIVRTGRARMLDKLQEEVPRGVVELASVRGIDAARAKRLHDELGVESLEDLERACHEGRVRALKGYGPKTEERLLKKLAEHRDRSHMTPVCDVLDQAESFVVWMRDAPGVVMASVAGGVRRWQEVVSSIDVVVATQDAERAAAHLMKHPRARSITGRAEDGWQCELVDGPPIRLFAAPPPRYGWALLSRSAAPEHLAGLKARAATRNLDLASLGGILEEDVYERLGLPALPPEVREGDDELELAAAGDDFSDLVRIEDIAGAVHCHTTDSDGRASIDEMAHAAAGLGLSYITITDHSSTAHYAGGLDTARLRAQREVIERARERAAVTIFAGTESDILPDGSLDFPLDDLRRLDVVIGSIHARNGQNEQEMTDRLLGLMRQPLRKIWGHPLGRLLLIRDPIAVRLDEVLDAAAATGSIIEINGDPRRLDLPPEFVRRARRKKLQFVASSDAHSTRGIGMYRYAVAMARRGGVRKKDVLNTLPAREFAEAVRPTGSG